MLTNAPIMVAVVLAAAGLVIASLRLVVVADRRQITQHMDRRGLKVHYLRWRPFRMADMGENMLRVYDAICEDDSGAHRRFQVKVAWPLIAEIKVEEIE